MCARVSVMVWTVSSSVAAAIFDWVRQEKVREVTVLSMRIRYDTENG